MDLFELLSLNIVLGGVVGVADIFYMVFLIKKRKKKEFLHEQKPK